jgi:hypothetical protein
MRFSYPGINHLARLFLPPDTPRDRIEILKEAFRKTYRDPEFHKDKARQSRNQSRKLTAPQRPRSQERILLALRRAQDERLST